MLFNSIDFALFLPTVFFLYWFTSKRNIHKQNIILLLSSYFFYGWWDWRFLSLIILSSLIDYTVGLTLSRKTKNRQRKLLLGISIFFNLGVLIFFKYYNFFLDNFVETFSFLGNSFEKSRLTIILPVGISFYTFQTLSYTIDIYRKKIEPTKDFIAFSAFVSFFPQLVAGPIERATNLLPQFFKERRFDYMRAVDGMRQILWGLFKKMVIADNCAVYVNDVFANYNDYSGIVLLVGAVLFAFQIYCDFSGYSDIAIGTARIFGFSLIQNFAFPYFSRDIAEFWRRWHISLSTWFRDYLYIPLGGSKVSNLVKIRNVFVIFIVSGFWHGANWTFIVWGALNAIYFLPVMLANRNRFHLTEIKKSKLLPGFKEFMQITSTFFLTTIAWVFFRVETLCDAFFYLQNTVNKIFDYQNLILPKLSSAIFIIVLITVEWLQRDKKHALQDINLRFNSVERWILYLAMVCIIFLYNGDQQTFIYFQF